MAAFCAVDRQLLLDEIRYLEQVTTISPDEYDRRVEQLLPLLENADQPLLRRWQRLDCWRWPEDTEEYFGHNIEIASAYIESAMQAEDTSAIADLLACRGWYYSTSGFVDAAMEDFNRAIELAKSLDDIRLIADVLSLRGEQYAYQGELALGLKDLLDAQKHYERLSEPFYIKGNLSSIANTYRRLGDYTRALEYLNQVLDDTSKETSFEDYILFRDQIALVYEDMHKYQEALDIYQESLTFYQEQKDEEAVAFSQVNIGGLKNAMGQFAEAIPYLKAAEAYFKNSPNPGTNGLILLYLGQAFNGLGRHEEALALFNASEPLIKQDRNRRFLEWLLLDKATALAGLERWTAAYKTLEAYVSNHKRLDQNLRKQQTARLQVEFDVAQREAENQRLKAQTQLQQERVSALEERRRWQVLALALAFGSILFLLLLLLSYRQVKRSKRLHYLALTDELTGLPNRRRMFFLGEEMTRDALNNGTAFSILVLDVDYFKRINDSHGHAIGDEVLKAIAPISLGAVRGGDYIGRTGGEEFMALLPGTNLKQAVVVAERIRHQLEQADFSHLADDLRVTISIGAGQLKKSDGGLNRLIKRADNALYKAKENGRNRVQASD